MTRSKTHFFNLRIDSRAKFDTPQRAEAVLRFISEHAPVKPVLCGTFEPFRTSFSSTELMPAIHMLVNEAKRHLTPDRPSGDVFLVHKKKPRATYHIERRRGPHTPFGKSSRYIDETYVQDAERLSRWLYSAVNLDSQTKP